MYNCTDVMARLISFRFQNNFLSLKSRVQQSVTAGSGLLKLSQIVLDVTRPTQHVVWEANIFSEGIGVGGWQLRNILFLVWSHKCTAM